MGGCDTPCSLTGEFEDISFELDDVLERSREENQQEIEDSRELLRRENQILVSSSRLASLPSGSRLLPVPQDRLSAFELPTHLVPTNSDRSFAILAPMTRSGRAIYSFGDGDLRLCSRQSSPMSLPSKHILAMSSDVGGGFDGLGVLCIPGIPAMIDGSAEGAKDAFWCFSDALSMFCSLTGRSPQAFYAALRWMIRYEEGGASLSDDHWRAKDYFDQGVIPRTEQFVEPLEYVLRGHYTLDEYYSRLNNKPALKEVVHPSEMRVRRALDGKFAGSEMDAEIYDLALWEFWNDYGNLYAFAPRTLFPIKAAYQLRNRILTPLQESVEQTRSTSYIESLPIELMISILSEPSINPIDLLCLRGASHTLRSFLEPSRVDSMVEQFIKRSARWILPNDVDWWDKEGFEDWEEADQRRRQEGSTSENTAPEFYELDIFKIRFQSQRGRESTEQRIWREWTSEAETEFGSQTGFPWLAYYLLSTSTRRSEWGRETNYAYSSSMRNRKRVHDIINNIEQLIGEVGIDPEKPIDVGLIEEYQKKNREGKERFRAWPKGTPQPDGADFVTE